MNNEDYARHLCCSGCNNYKCYTDKKQCRTLKDILIMAERKDEQHAKEKQQWIDDTVDWLKNSTYGYLKEEGGDVVLDREALANDYALYKKNK